MTTTIYAQRFPLTGSFISEVYASGKKTGELVSSQLSIDKFASETIHSSKWATFAPADFDDVDGLEIVAVVETHGFHVGLFTGEKIIKTNKMDDWECKEPGYHRHLIIRCHEVRGMAWKIAEIPNE